MYGELKLIALATSLGSLQEQAVLLPLPSAASSLQNVYCAGIPTNNLPQVIHGSPRGNSGGSSLAWLYIPEYRDSVLVALDGNMEGVVVYLSDVVSNANYALGGKGRFLWKSTSGASLHNVPALPSPPHITSVYQKGSWDPAPSVTAWRQRLLLDRNHIFEEVMGIPEEKFKGLVNVPGKEIIINRPYSLLRIGEGAKDPKAIVRHTWPPFSVSRVKKWFNGPGMGIVPASGRAALEQCMTTFSQSLIGKLDDEFLQKIKHLQGKSLERGSLEIRYRDNNKPQHTDIRALHREFPGGWFQLASNFNCLEGGMENFSKDIADMNQHPVQGEDASIATPSAVIVRRYFHTFDQRDLLGNENLHKVVVIGKGPSGSFVQGVQAAGKKLMSDPEKFTHMVSKLVAIGVHQNVPVLGEYPLHAGKSVDIRVPRNDAPFCDNGPTCRSRAAFDYRVSDGLTVNHLLTAAMDINPKHVGAAWSGMEKQRDLIAQALLRAAYEGSILVPFLKGSTGDHLILTLVGTGAFQNRSEWVYAILESLAPLMVLSGLRIHLIIWGKEHEAIRKLQGAFDAALKLNDRELMAAARNVVDPYRLMEEGT